MTDTATLGTIEHVDPHSIEVEVNVRTVVAVDPALVASIREYGVLEPVVCRRTDSGLTVRMGQRRVLAAREAGRATIPAYVVEGDDSTVTRLVEQFAENEHRANLTATERAAVFQQLAFEGLSITKIAKATGVKKAEVEAGIKVAGHEFATEAATAHALTLDQAAVLIEFEEDPEAVQSLIECAEEEPAQFDHLVQRIRDERERQARRAAAAEEYAAKGYVVLDQRPGWDDPTKRRVTQLRTQEGNIPSDDDLNPEAPRYVHLFLTWDGEVDATVFVDPTEHGLTDPNNERPTGPMTEEEKAERKQIIANNKAWSSAETVRREWLTGFLSRKTLPKDATAYVAQVLAVNHYAIRRAVERRNPLAAELLGIEGPTGYHELGALPQYAAQPGKAAHAVLAIALGAVEATLDRHTWRNPSKTDAEYLSQLAAWGYTLSDVEQIVVDTIAQRGEHGAPDGDPISDAEDFDPDEFAAE